MPIERDNRNVNDAIDEVVSEVNAELAAIQEDIDNASLKIYLARFSQSGTSNPTVTEFLNTTGETFTWLRDGVGFYYCSIPIRPFMSGTFNYLGGNSNYITMQVPNYSGNETAHIKIHWEDGILYLEVYGPTGTLTEFSTIFSTKSLDLPAIYTL